MNKGSSVVVPILDWYSRLPSITWELSNSLAGQFCLDDLALTHSIWSNSLAIGSIPLEGEQFHQQMRSPIPGDAVLAVAMSMDSAGRAVRTSH